ncbi:glycosyltransferase family 2 protein [Fulvivirga sp. M361]|uniref:glycosyltransferase family 2 protein n=1 Tax=Fulvivirga sp. M361 TaxID=2594266 RepID=UPI00117B8415|nr:glycosyltransferase family 2 protein [Fulvivirga sp. M361]TRX60132.1 glycosyltransferase family 2 protein [Fulvivirga sp. M361]
MAAGKPLISIIILNYNQIDVTCEFLDSTKSLTYPNYEIIMVDNASKADPTERINNEYPEVRLIKSDVNLGFTGGNNLGIEKANGEYFFIVNNDTEVTPDLLEALLEPFEVDETVGMVSPKIKFHAHPDTIQYAGFTKINPFTGRNRAIGNKEKDEGQHDSPCYTNYAHGAAMLVKKEVIEKVGMFPDNFFIYYEELDWSAHTKRAGFEIYYQPKGVIYHKESITMGKESAIKAYYHNRNRILFMRRNTHGLHFFVFSLFLTFFIIPKSILKYIIKGQGQHLKNFLRAIAWNLKTPKYITN